MWSGERMYCGLYKDSTLLLYANVLRFLPWLDGTLVPNCHHNSHHNTQAKWCVHYSDSFVSKVAAVKKIQILILRVPKTEMLQLSNIIQSTDCTVCTSLPESLPFWFQWEYRMIVQKAYTCHATQTHWTLNNSYISLFSNFFLLPPPFPNQQRFLCWSQLKWARW